MNKSTALPAILTTLSVSARARELTDSAWAARAGLRKETLSRLRGRQSCDFRTLTALAEVVGAEIGVLPGRPPDSSEDGHFPAKLDRDYEERLVRLCASRNLDSAAWAANGPRFFMAGLATMLASAQGFDRRALLALAERLHPGASETEVFNRWLARAPVSPTRFMSLLDAEAPSGPADRHSLAASCCAACSSLRRSATAGAAPGVVLLADGAGAGTGRMIAARAAACAR